MPRCLMALPAAWLVVFGAAATADTGYVEEGIASWYGHPFHGRLTASGEVFDKDQLTAAHPELPLGLEVDVTHVESGRSVQVEITDRGPFVDGRVIDLSEAAAQELDMIEDGLAPVRIEASEEALRAVEEQQAAR